VTGDVVRQIHLEETKKALFAGCVITEIKKKNVRLQSHVVMLRYQGDRGSRLDG
jgi:hypothetical protein